MKLEKSDKYVGMIIGTYMLVMLSLLANENSNIKEDAGLPIEIATSENIIKYDIPYDSNIEIINAGNKISNQYKILRFIDPNGYYKIMFTIGYVDYEENSGGLITTYKICDAFSKEELFKTIKKGRKLDLENIYDTNPLLEGIKILSYDDLSDIKKYSNNEFNKEVSIIENRNLTEYELKEIYENLFDESVKINLSSYKVYKR